MQDLSTGGNKGGNQLSHTHPRTIIQHMPPRTIIQHTPKPIGREQRQDKKYYIDHFHITAAMLVHQTNPVEDRN